MQHKRLESDVTRSDSNKRSDNSLSTISNGRGSVGSLLLDTSNGRRRSSDLDEQAEVKVKDDGGVLYSHGLCRWPGCDTPCDDLVTFSRSVK